MDRENKDCSDDGKKPNSKDLSDFLRPLCEFVPRDFPRGGGVRDQKHHRDGDHKGDFHGI